MKENNYVEISIVSYNKGLAVEVQSPVYSFQTTEWQPKVEKVNFNYLCIEVP